VNVVLSFLAFVAVAGIYGAISVSRTILYMQTIPAALRIMSLLI